MAYDASVHAKAIDLIKLSAEMTTAAESGHVTSAAGLAHLITVLLYDHMRYDPAKPDDPAADRLILSEGHACPIVYAAAADLGIAIVDKGRRRPMTRADALTLRAIDSPIDGHPNPAEGFPFFPAATGSLGQGLSIAAGMALAARLDGLDSRFFCIIGDGESREGQIWEAADFLIDFDLKAVCPIFNCNHYGQSDPVSHQQSPEVTAAKLEAMGFVVRTVDGHEPSQIRQALRDHAAAMADGKGKPFAIVAKTVKGWGITEVIHSDVHGKPLEKAQLALAFAELDRKAKELGAVWTKGDLQIPKVTAVAPSPATISRPLSFEDACKKFGQEKALQKGVLATRKAYGLALRALGQAYPNVVALDGDVKNSTFSEWFARDPSLRGRFFECRIAEQNMISVGGGLAAGGKIPFCSTFGKFLARGYDQIEMGFISRFPLKLVGSHVGVSLAADGPSQMALPDVAYFHAWSTVTTKDGRPFFYLLNPADARCAYDLTLAMLDHDGPCYLRTLRPETPFLYDAGAKFFLGGHQVLSRGGDLLLVASGYLVHEAKKALDVIGKAGIRATLVDLYSLPFDAAAIVQLARDCGGKVLTLEDNFGAGFGAAVATALLEHGGNFQLKQMHVRIIPKSGREPDEVLQYLGLAAADIVKAARGLVGSRS